MGPGALEAWNLAVFLSAKSQAAPLGLQGLWAVQGTGTVFPLRGRCCGAAGEPGGT